MGKYGKKGKIRAKLGAMESSPPVLGVRTRARTLALQQSCCLQLRNRRLVKSKFPPVSPSRKQRKRGRSGIKRIQGRRRSGSGMRVEAVSSVSMVEEVDVMLEMGEAPGVGVEASFGENEIELDETGRTTRESTPSSFIRDLRPIITPRSPVRPTYTRTANSTRAQHSVQTRTARVIDDFLADLEKQQQSQQKKFMEKYNFDFVNELPLQGRFEWARIDP